MSAETIQGWVPTDDFGTRILLARRHVALNVREAAARCGVHYATWSTWERGARPADMATIVQKISEGLGCDRDWLMWGGPMPANDGTRTPARVRAIEQLPRLDLNQQPAGWGLALVSGGLHTPTRHANTRWGRFRNRRATTRPADAARAVRSELAPPFGPTPLIDDREAA